MSHLQQEVNLRLMEVEQLAEQLLATVNEISSLAAIAMHDPHREGWDEGQSAISNAIDELTDSVGRSITFATVVLRKHGDTLLSALGAR